MKDKGKTDKSIIELIASISTSLLSLGRHFLKKKWQPSWKPASHCPIIHTKRYKQGPFPNEKFRGRKKTEPPPSCPLLFFFFTFFTTTRKISLLQRERERERERDSPLCRPVRPVSYIILHRSCAGRHAGAGAAVASDERDPDYPFEVVLNFGTRRERGQLLPFVSNWFHNERRLFRSMAKMKESSSASHCPMKEKRGNAHIRRSPSRRIFALEK